MQKTRGEKEERPGERRKMHDSCGRYFTALRWRALKTIWEQ